MNISNYLKIKFEQFKKAVIKLKVKQELKKKSVIDSRLDPLLSKSVDKAVDTIGSGNIIKAAKAYKSTKNSLSRRQ